MSLDTKIKRLIGGSIGQRVVVESSGTKIFGVIRTARFNGWRKERTNNTALFKITVTTCDCNFETFGKLRTFTVKKLPKPSKGSAVVTLKDFTPKFGD